MSQVPVHPLHSVGWSDRVDALFAPLLARGLVPGRVVGRERGACVVHTSEGERTLTLAEAAVGDWLAIGPDGLSEILPRWSELTRVDPEGRRQVLAADLDLVLVAAPADRLSLTRVEREVVIGWESGARPVVVLTKADVAPAGTVEDLVARLVTVEVVVTSALALDGVDALRALLVHPVTAALLGPSGAGKSTLVNALLGEDRLAVGEVRTVDQRGRHTTTSRRLVPLPTGASLVDMPGLRSLGTDASSDTVVAAFSDVDRFSGDCRFTDCTHEVEPGCAVQAAVERGELDPARVASFRKLARETAFERRRAEPLARQEAERVWKQRTKEQRRLYRDRDR